MTILWIHNNVFEYNCMEPCHELLLLVDTGILNLKVPTGSYQCIWNGTFDFSPANFTEVLVFCYFAEVLGLCWSAVVLESGNFTEVLVFPVLTPWHMHIYRESPLFIPGILPQKCDNSLKMRFLCNCDTLTFLMALVGWVDGHLNLLRPLGT